MARRKKGTFEITIQGNKFPFEGHSIIEGKSYSVKNTIVGQTVKAKVIRNKKEKVSGKLIEIIEKSEFEVDSKCIHFPKCGGCLLQSVEYDMQIKLVIPRYRPALTRSARRLAFLITKAPIIDPIKVTTKIFSSAPDTVVPSVICQINPLWSKNISLSIYGNSIYRSKKEGPRHQH